MIKLFVAAMLVAMVLPVAASAEEGSLGLTIGREHDQGRDRNRGYHEHRRGPVIVIPDGGDRHEGDRDRRHDRGDFPDQNRDRR